MQHEYVVLWHTSLKQVLHKKARTTLHSYHRTLFDRQITGHIEQPSVQQQQRHPQKSHLTLTGSVLRRVTFTRLMVDLYSSGATRACSEGGNSPSNRFDRPKLKGRTWHLEKTHLPAAHRKRMATIRHEIHLLPTHTVIFPAPLTTIGSGTRVAQPPKLSTSSSSRFTPGPGPGSW
jgi:hypothetical protein